MAKRNFEHSSRRLHRHSAGRLHQHRAVVTHALRQHAGVPYKVEQRVYSDCRRVLDVRTVRRAAA